MSVFLLLVVLALVAAIVSLFRPVRPVLEIAVLLLCCALLVGGRL